MKRTVAAMLLVAIAPPALASPGDMSVGTFLAKADALRARGPMALFSSDIKLLKTEAMAAGRDYRVRLAGERQQGNPSSCPPPRSSMGQEALMTHLRSYPAPQRSRVTMRTAMADWFVRTYPCAH